MRSRRVVGEELDRAKAVREMDGENRNQQHDDHERGRERHKSPAEDEQAANDLDDDRRPPQKKCEWHAHRVQDADEVVGTASELGVAVLKESVADDQSKRQRKETGRRWKRGKGQSPKYGSEPHVDSFATVGRLLRLVGSSPLRIEPLSRDHILNERRSSWHPRFRSP